MSCGDDMSCGTRRTSRTARINSAIGVVIVLAGSIVGLAGIARAAEPSAPASLRRPDEFAFIANESARSIALFTEAGKVIQHPRCVNCHPAGEVPLQTDAGRPHQPLVVRGADGHGSVGLQCDACHHAANFDPARVPGHPRWHLAPASMAWEGKSLREICEQIKDPARNGNLNLPALVHHMAEDSLVGTAWNPGAGRTPAPGTQAQFGALIRAWVDTGAACPDARTGSSKPQIVGPMHGSQIARRAGRIHLRRGFRPSAASWSPRSFAASANDCGECERRSIRQQLTRVERARQSNDTCRTKLRLSSALWLP
jgi:hypothetical protein